MNRGRAGSPSKAGEPPERRTALGMRDKAPPGTHSRKISFRGFPGRRL